MTPRIEALKDIITNKCHCIHRRASGLDLASDFAERKLSPIDRVAQRTVRLLNAENPAFLEGERIAFLRTITDLPPLFTDDEWTTIKQTHFIHELGHVCNISPDYETTIAKGLQDHLKHARSLHEATNTEMDEEGMAFLSAVIAETQAVLDLADRYRAEAIARGMNDLADVLARVPRYPARNFIEALQFFRVLHFTLWLEGEYHNTVGRFDQYMWPYLEKDLADGKLNRESALELVEEFFLTFNRDSDLYPGVQQGDNGQSIVLGGVTADGGDGFNLLSELCLEASRNLALIDPKINLRVNAMTPRNVYQLGTELTKKGLGFPQYSNDDVVIPGLVALGYDEEDAKNYVVAACWEFIVPGKGMDIPNVAAISFPAVILKCVRDHLEAAASFEEFFGLVKQEIANKCQETLRGIRNLWMIPAPFMSLLMSGCLETGNDISRGAKYNNFGFHGTGISTAVDSLSAIRKLVFVEKSTSPRELLFALESNFENNADLLVKLRFESPKFGDGDDGTIDVATELLNSFADATSGLRNERGGIVRAGTGSAMYYLWHARDLGATPDGRRRGECFATNYAPTLFARVGPLSVIRSFAAPNLKRVINGGPLTMEFHSSLFEHEDSQQKVADFVQLFIELGGHQMQLNAVNREQLLAAQAHPEQYGNLIVRIWGWSAYFVELDREYQDHVISRQEYVV